MAERKSLDERIVAAQDELKQRENHLKELIQKQKQADRNARTKRLIERGAILESLLNEPESLTNEQIKTLLQRTVGSSYGVNMLAKIRALAGETAAITPETVQAGGV